MIPRVLTLAETLSIPSPGCRQDQMPPAPRRSLPAHPFGRNWDAGGSGCHQPVSMARIRSKSSDTWDRGVLSLPAFSKELGRDPGTGDDRGDTGARSCRSQWESDRFRLRSSILGPLAPASPRSRQCIIHTSVPIYIPASSPGPACDGLWPRRSWDHAAISICSRCLPAQSNGIGNRCGSVQQERRDRCPFKDLGG